MTGPNGARDRKGASRKGEGSDRRRRSAAAGPKGGAVGAIRTIGSYVFNRKYTLIYLLFLIILAFAIRSVWYYDAAYTGGPTPLLSGNDPDYHKRTVDYFVENHHFLERDPLLNYPGGGPNPNPPAYSTSIALIGYAMKPFFGGDLEDSVWFSMEIGAALWAALTIIPVYLFTKEMFGRRSGYFAAFVLAVMAGNIERTPLGFSDHDAFFMFFIVTGFFFLLKALRATTTKTYVRAWRSPREITLGLTEFAQKNKLALLYAAMAGIALAAVALSWKGFPYALAIIFVYVLFHLLVNKFRRIDNTAIGLTILVTVSIMMLVSLPYYMTMHFMNWYEAPAILFAGICLIVAVFLFTRDLPWLLIIPVLMLIIVVALTVVWLLLPDVWLNVFSGAGYFIRTKLYGTIAEAQPPDINRLVFSYGMTTFFMAMYGAFVLIKNMPKGWKNDSIFTAIWALVSVYMAVAAIRFMYNATPVFAILSGWIGYDILRRLDYKRMLRVLRSMKGDFIKAFKFAVKLRHVGGALFLVFLIVVPNLWHGIDAGIPYETKKDADLKIYNALPGFMRPSKDIYDPDSNNLWYLGSFGTSFMSDYWAQGMWWLAEQDTWQPEDERPAFISWWDYGHWCTQVGKHPTAADNFQNGVEFAGNFIASQGEEEAAALMLVRLFELNRKDASVRDYMRGQLGDTVTDELLDLFDNAGKYTPLIPKYPERYGLKDKEINARNTIYMHGTWLMKKNTDMDQRVDMLLWFRNAVGDEFRYFAVDSRLMPTSYRNTGIFYAPITLSDNMVEEFIQIVAIHEGNQITLDVASQLTPEQQQNLQYQLVWKRPFFESMFYRTFIGYSGYDQGPDFKDTGIPFVSGDIAQNPPLPGWNMSHWRIAHRTIHWLPYNASGVQTHGREWEAVSYDKALKVYNRNEALDAAHPTNNDEINKTIIDDAIRTISSGVVFLKYYAGAYINGTVLTETGEPIPGATITVHDDYRFLGGYMGPDFVGIPHGTTQTDENGTFSILAPYGNVTVVASNGGSMDYFNLHEANILNTSSIYISDDAAMRVGEYNFTVDLVVPTAYQDGIVFADVSNNGQFDEDEDLVMANATLTVEGTRGLNRTYRVTTYPDGYYELVDILPGEYRVSVEYEGHTIEDVSMVFVGANDTKHEDVVVTYSKIRGQVIRRDGKDAEGTEITVRDLQTNRTWNEEAEVDGNYEFKELFPGNYSVELYVPGTRPINESVTLEALEDLELNLTLLPTAFIEGTVYRDGDGNGRADSGEGMVNATITFHRIYAPGELTWTVTTNGTGHYNTSLPTGLYSTYVHEYVGDEHLSALVTIEIDADEWLYRWDLALSAAYRVNGSLKRESTGENNTIEHIDAGRTQVSIWTENGRLNLTANATGDFRVYLPAGNYSLFTYKSVGDRDRPILHLAYVNVTDADISLGEVILLNGTKLIGDVYFNINGDEKPDDDEVLPGIELVFEAGGHVFNVTTDVNGHYELPAVHANYTVSIDAKGYHPYTDFHDSSVVIEAGTNNTTVEKRLPEYAKQFAIDPINVTYNGLVGHDADKDGNLSGDGFPGMLVTFEALVENPAYDPNAETTNVTADGEGRYELELAPGVYRVKVHLDNDEALGTYRYRHEGELYVKPGENGTFNVWLDRLVRMNGTIATDDGWWDISRTNIKVGTTGKTLTITNGSFDGHVPVGEHLLTTTYFRSIEDRTYKLEYLADMDRPRELNLTMYQVVTFSGRVYYDRNGNGQYDSGNETEPFGEEAGDVITMALKGLSDESIGIEGNGNFTAQVHPFANYTIYIAQNAPDPRTGVPYQMFYNETINLTQDVTMDILVERRIEVTGRVYWDRNENNESSPEEGIEDAVVTLESSNGELTFNATTNDVGLYRQHVNVDTEGEAVFLLSVSHPAFTPNETEWELEIDRFNHTKDLPMTPLNVTIDGTTFLDLNENGRLNRYESGVEVDGVRFWDTTNASMSFETASDVNGSFNATVPPGEYDVLAWSDRPGDALVYLGVVEIEPSGEVTVVELPMRPGRRLSGTMYFHNHTGVNGTVPEVNLTFTPLDGKGQVPVLEVGNGQYSTFLPDGRYRVNGTYTDEEFGVEMSYDVEREFRLVLRDRTDIDLNFTKLEVFKLELWWDDVAPVYIDKNSTANFTVYAKNVGSMNGTFDLTVDVPNDWTFQFEFENISLNLSRTTHFWVLVNSSERAPADVHTSTVKAIPRDSDDEPSELDLEVHVNQFYGFTVIPAVTNKGSYIYIEERDEHHVTYSLQVENTGNGKEVINLTFQSVLDWEIEMPISDVELVAYEPQPSIPVEVTVPSTSVLQAQNLRITATPQNDPDGRPVTIDLPMTFPDLKASKGKVSGDVAGEPLEWPEEAPGFGLISVLLALVVVAIAARRRRWWRS